MSFLKRVWLDPYLSELWYKKKDTLLMFEMTCRQPKTDGVVTGDYSILRSLEYPLLEREQHLPEPPFH